MTPLLYICTITQLFTERYCKHFRIDASVKVNDARGTRAFRAESLEQVVLYTLD